MSTVKNLGEIPDQVQFQIPKDSYDARCVKCEQRDSRGGIPMLMFTNEIVAPLTKKLVGGSEEVEIAGTQFTEFVMLYGQEIDRLEVLVKEGAATDEETKNLNNYKKWTGFSLSKLKSLHKAMELPLDGFDESAVDTSAYEGKTFNALLKSEKNESKGSDGKVIVDGDGKPVVTYNIRVDKYLGKARWPESHQPF